MNISIKLKFDRALGQHSPQGPAFPSIISAGKNNFCIHYYSYKGQAQDGDMILNDVGAQYDSLMTDVSRGWPCNGRYSEKQRLLYTCALNTSNHMFEIIRPSMKMADVDATIRRFNAEQLKDAGVLDSVENIGTYMWHGGAHHVGYDVHDVVEVPEVIAPGMVFCVDVGIYHEEWGIGFRLEDNCLVTEDGCENLSVITPEPLRKLKIPCARESGNTNLPGRFLPVPSRSDSGLWRQPGGSQPFLSWLNRSAVCFFSSKVRKSFPCTLRGRELISSRNKVPPSAASTRPVLPSRLAPVKAPFS